MNEVQSKRRHGEMVKNGESESDPRFWVLGVNMCQPKRGTVQHGWWQRTEGSHCASQKSGEDRCWEGQGIFVSKKRTPKLLFCRFKTLIIDESCQCALPGWWRRQGRVRSPALVWLSWSHNVFGWKDASLRIQKRQAKMDLKCASILKIGAHWSTCVQGDMFYCLGIAIEHQLRLCLHAVLPNHPGESSSGDYAVVFLAKCLPKLKSLGKKVARLKDRNCQTFK